MEYHELFRSKQQKFHKIKVKTNIERERERENSLLITFKLINLKNKLDNCDIN